ncbi:MAG: CAP domain-containing protein [Candidatus Paceibacterota bacterium]|jgi:uncharacterized protein YkwD
MNIFKKSIFNLLVIIFVLSTLYIVKGDLFILYNKIKHNFFNIPEQPIEIGVDEKTEAGKSTVIKKQVVTPGTLTVSDEELKAEGIIKNESAQLTASGIITFTNEARKANGNLPPLTYNAKITASAKKKVQDMFAKQYFEHVSPSGVGVANLADNEGYLYIMIGENLALGNFPTNKNLVDAWMASPGHRANILNNRYTEIGVAVGQGVYQGRSTWIAVQHFGLPISACPIIDKNLKDSIDAQRIILTNMESELITKREELEKKGAQNDPDYNDKKDTYNALVREYNSLVVKIRADITTYNDQVKAFNECAQG